MSQLASSTSFLATTATATLSSPFLPTSTPQPYPFSEFVTVPVVEPRYGNADNQCINGFNNLRCYVPDQQTALSICAETEACFGVTCGIDNQVPFRCSLYPYQLDLYAYPSIFNKTAYVKYNKRVVLDSTTVGPYTKGKDAATVSIPTKLPTTIEWVIPTWKPNPGNSGWSDPYNSQKNNGSAPVGIIVGAVLFIFIIIICAGVSRANRMSMYSSQQTTTYQVTTVMQPTSNTDLPPYSASAPTGPIYTASSTTASSTPIYAATPTNLTTDAATSTNLTTDVAPMASFPVGSARSYRSVTPTVDFTSITVTEMPRAAEWAAAQAKEGSKPGEKTYV
ncbi:hypothetical protein HDU97_004101 [Phlyctochytrium planicorne]|nr:hypothetical protein HDU97_004101 [Phlyctochytrium planicorne]